MQQKDFIYNQHHILLHSRWNYLQIKYVKKIGKFIKYPKYINIGKYYDH